MLRAAQRLDHTIRLIVLSNYATADMRRTCEALGASRVFDKSGEIDALVEHCIALSDAAASGREQPGAA